MSDCSLQVGSCQRFFNFQDCEQCSYILTQTSNCWSFKETLTQTKESMLTVCLARSQLHVKQKQVSCWSSLVTEVRIYYI